MLNVNVQFEKNAVSLNNKKGTFLLEMIGSRKDVKKMKRKGLNVSLVVDTSYSMLENLNNLNIGHPQQLQIRGGFNLKLDPNQIMFGNQIAGIGACHQQVEGMYPKQILKNKLEQAKLMAVQLINELKDGDIFSLIKFDEKASVVQEAVVITESMKPSLIMKVQSLQIGGNTNLYDGWETGAKENAKFLSEKTLNRVIMMTDGQVNQGIMDFNEITKRVGAMTKAKIQTSTIGIGGGFQEKLLSAMAENGEGNFFFIEKDEDFSHIFKTELYGMTSSIVTNMEVSFNAEKDVQVKQLNGFKEENGIIKSPNLRLNQKTSLVFDFEISSDMKKKDKSNQIKLGELIISGIDLEGKKVTYKEELFVDKLTDSEYSELENNGEVTVQKVLMNVALEQQRASDLILRGKGLEARALMGQSINFLKETYSNNATAAQMIASMEGGLLKDDNNLSKTMISTAYNSRYGLSQENLKESDDKK